MSKLNSQVQVILLDAQPRFLLKELGLSKIGSGLKISPGKMVGFQPDHFAERFLWFGGINACAQRIIVGWA